MEKVNSFAYSRQTYLKCVLSALGIFLIPQSGKIAISCMLRQIREFSSRAIRHGLYTS